jgi:DNA-binding NarL/FixJ family response regulator
MTLSILITMLLKSLLGCADEGTAAILRGILEEFDIGVDACSEMPAVFQKLMENSFDAIIVDGDDQKFLTESLRKTRSSPLNGTALFIALVEGPDAARQLFAMGANFVIYKPISAERARSSLQAARSLMRRERRRHPRIPVYTEAGIGYGSVENVPTTLMDLSEEGTCIQCERKLPPTAKVYFQFILPGHTEIIRVAGQVIWQDSTGRVGLRFTGVPQASRRLLKVWLQHNRFRKAEARVPNPGRKKQAQGSPATPPGDPEEGLVRFRATPGNRRNLSRHPCSLGAEVYRQGTTVPHRCRLTDISTGGCYVETPSPLPVEAKVEILVRTRDLKIRTRGVVQVTHPGFGMGVKFETEEAQERDEIQQLISLLDSQQALEPFVP